MSDQAPMPGMPDDPRQRVRAEADKLITAGRRRITSDLAPDVVMLLPTGQTLALAQLQVVKILSDHFGPKDQKLNAAPLGDGRNEYMQIALFSEEQLKVWAGAQLAQSDKRVATVTAGIGAWLAARPDDSRSVEDWLALLTS